MCPRKSTLPIHVTVSFPVKEFEVTNSISTGATGVKNPVLSLANKFCFSLLINYWTFTQKVEKEGDGSI